MVPSVWNLCNCISKTFPVFQDMQIMFHSIHDTWFSLESICVEYKVSASSTKQQQLVLGRTRFLQPSARCFLSGCGYGSSTQNLIPGQMCCSSGQAWEHWLRVSVCVCVCVIVVHVRHMSISAFWEPTAFCRLRGSTKWAARVQMCTSSKVKVKKIQLHYVLLEIQDYQSVWLIWSYSQQLADFVDIKWENRATASLPLSKSTYYPLNMLICKLLR